MWRGIQQRIREVEKAAGSLLTQSSPMRISISTVSAGSGVMTILLSSIPNLSIKYRKAYSLEDYPTCTCRCCRQVVKRAPLGRVSVCPGCGAVIHRDANGASNICPPLDMDRIDLCKCKPLCISDLLNGVEPLAQAGAKLKILLSPDAIVVWRYIATPNPAGFSRG